MIRRPPRSTLFPHPPLFRSRSRDGSGELLSDRRALRSLRSLWWDVASDQLWNFRAMRLALCPPNPKELLTTASTDRKSTRLNSSHTVISYAVFCLKKKKEHT